MRSAPRVVFFVLLLFFLFLLGVSLVAAETSPFIVDVPLQPKQEKLWELVDQSPYTKIGYGGSRGGAKSHGGRAVMLLRRFKYPGTRGLIFRRTFNDLWENHIQPLFDQYPFMRSWYNTGHRELTLPNESVIKFGYAENPGDIDQFQGKQYGDIFPDEATKLAQLELEKLAMCCRMPGMPKFTPKMWWTMNPGGVGHAYVKRVMLDRVYTENEVPSEYAFIQAFGWDNVGWADKALAEDGLTARDYYRWTDEQRFQYFITRTEYGRVLNAMPGKLRVGHLMGRWDVFAGQYFEIWDPSKHVVRLEAVGLKDWWTRWLSIDWGFEHNTAAHWHALRLGEKGSCTVTYRELMANHEAPRALAQKIAERCRLGEKAETLRAIYLSPDAFAKRTNEETIAEQMGQVFREHGLPYPTPADNDRVGGWQLMYEKLDRGEWVITDNCQALIECLPTLTRDEDKVEDVEKMLGDDAADSARYGLKSYQVPAQAPLAERVMQRVKSTDPSQRVLQIQSALHRERQAEPGPARRRNWMSQRWGRQ